MAEETSKKTIVHVRVMTDPLIVEDVATKIGEYLESQGYELPARVV